jgi:hypothetical protein
MFYDVKGNPDPNGDYEFRDGRWVIRDNRQIGMSIFMVDGARSRSSTPSAREAVEAARRAWMVDKQNAHRRRPSTDAAEEQPRTFGDARGGIAQARAARLDRLHNAHRG